MLNEADDFIDSLPEGQQDRQGDAVYHALRGMNTELMEVRNSRNITPELSENVEHIDLTGTGSTRGMAMRLYRPANMGNRKLPLLIYLHGGGWTFGSINSCAAFCDAVAADGKAMVLAIDYSLAPEKPFPAAMYDVMAALEYAAAHADEWGTSKSLISLGGDSAGGNLALGAALQLADETSAPASVKSLILFYPVVKAYKDGSESWKEFSRSYALDGRLMEAFNEAYLSGSKAGANGSVGSDSALQADSSRNPLVSPADATDDQLKKLPPLLMISGGRDILRDQGEEFVSRLKKLGNRADRVEFPGAVHLFITVDGQPTAFGKAARITSDYLNH